MELALNLGFRTVAQLEKEMTTEEFMLWLKYRSMNLLPLRRQEFYLAQIASQISYVYHALGGKAYPIKDFLLDFNNEKESKKDTAETGSQAIGAIAGGGVRVIHIGKKRKANGRKSG